MCHELQIHERTADMRGLQIHKISISMFKA